ncbi:MAG: DEAD/DEAH box helicase [Rhodobacter sp.]|uniref:DEAD/DEAH box helicase n=1 Tax=Pararhodobacter sp. TaxID=2127056 RepID=UPI002CA4A0DD|nr:DEAD/DEAH box helicase [Pararhodobacter sp.]MCC0074829.1 DEAD/DEAH box helicase [Rhodobacter sp.]HPD90828.1 DEAD/DEAH box helicase [Pararhodobacter sp.]
MTDFSMLGLNPALLAALTRAGLETPTPIQARAIPPLMDGRDLMGLAQTGTGKTLAFGLPMLHRLAGQGKPAAKSARALILAPTRELVQQIAEALSSLGQGSQTSIVTVVGGASINRQTDRLVRGCDVLVATPGRLIDLLDRGAVSLARVQMLVLDEADQMLDLGFIHALRKIARHLPAERQTMLFSATMPKDMSEVADTYLNRPVRVQVAPPGKTAEKIDQAVHFVAQGDKATLLAEYLRKHPGELALVFGRTKHGSEKLSRLLDSWGFSVGSIHGNKSQSQRERTLAAFRAGEIQVLVATDVAARGLDIPLVAHVYNFDLPNVPENYVHRIGRTARAGREGRAVALCAPAEMADLRAIEALTRQPIEVIGGTAWPETMAAEARTKARAAANQGRGGRPGGGRPGQPAGQKPGAKPNPRTGQKPAPRTGAKSGAAPATDGAAKPAKPRQNRVHPAYAEAMAAGKPRRPRRPRPDRSQG